jgi:hypothetical protein
MDEKEYKTARVDFVSIPCVFEKSILSSRVCCAKAARKNLAEREVVSCSSAEYQTRCQSWLQLLRKKSQFALHLPNINDGLTVLPHSKEMKVQVGGILGLVALLEDIANNCDEGRAVQCDVYSVLNTCTIQYGLKFEHVPFEEIVQSVVSFRLR